MGMSDLPENLRYTKEHEWVENITADRIRFGITDYAQGALGDIVYIQLPKLNDEIRYGDICGEVESTKSVSEIFAPVTGKVVLINESLNSSPELINQEPYDRGWIAEVEIENLPELLTSDQYNRLINP
jgi:glycine cleavage system H protein